MADENEPRLTTERVAFWYFRLNGYLQMENFIVHPSKGRGSQRTDADLIGVRFPYRNERLIDDPDDVMQDDTDALGLTSDWTDIVIVEVKTNDPCTLNGPWTNKDAENVHRVLAAIGCFDPDRLDEVATCMYGQGLFEDEGLKLRVRLVAIGASINSELKRDHPGVVQLTWPMVMGFIGDRLYRYRSAKKHTPQWESTITFMQKLVSRNTAGQDFNSDHFIDDCLRLMGVKSE